MVKSTTTKAKHSAKSTKSSRQWFDTIVFLFILAIFIVALFANYSYFQHVSVYFRAVGWIVLAIIFIGLMLLTRKGKAIFSFSKDARAELRKVHWPSRHETIQTTLMVIVMVVLVGIFLWVIDSLFMWLVNWLTSQRG